MFLNERLNRMERVFEERLKELEWKVKETVYCDGCGCLVKRDLAVKGKSTVEVNELVYATSPYAEYLQTHYWCKRCHKEKP